MAPSRKNDEIINSISVFITVYVYCLYVCLLVGGWCGVCVGRAGFFGGRVLHGAQKETLVATFLGRRMHLRQYV